MSEKLFFPLFIQVLLTFTLLVGMAILRISSLLAGQVKFKDVSLGQNAWPERLTKVTNSFHNQLEMPTFFFVAVLFGVVIKNDSVLFLNSAWAYVVLRIVHALIHNTTNNVRHRFAAFLFSNLVLMCMWIQLLIKLV